MAIIQSVANADAKNLSPFVITYKPDPNRPDQTRYSIPRDYATAVREESKSGTLTLSENRLKQLRKEGRLHVAYKNAKELAAKRRASRDTTMSSNADRIAKSKDKISLFPGSDVGMSASGFAGSNNPGNPEGSNTPKQSYMGIALLVGAVVVFKFFLRKKASK